MTVSEMTAHIGQFRDERDRMPLPDPRIPHRPPSLPLIPRLVTGMSLIHILAALVLLPGAMNAQSDPLYIQFSPGSVKGALYRPDTGPAPHVGVLLMHRTANFMNALGCTELASRGFLVLCMNPRFDNNEASVDWEKIALDVASGVKLLRGQPGITRVVLYGHSGGGPTMSFYQAVAENGPSYCQGPDKISPCTDELAGLPPSDGLILVDAHPGNPVNRLRSLNPAVTNDAAILDRNAAAELDTDLDPFSAAHGFARQGKSSYPEEFQRRYFAAQAARMNRLIALALDRQARMRRGEYRYPDDDVFLVVRGGGARLMQMDATIHSGTVAPQKLLRNDGSVVTQIIRGVRLPATAGREENESFDGGTTLLTIRSFLSANAIRAGDSMDKIDWCSSNNSTPCAVQRIHVPLLVTAMGAHYFIRDNEIHYELAASEDKDFIVLEGATHGVTPCTRCETTPGQYANSVRNYYDYLRDWINARFPAR